MNLSDIYNHLSESYESDLVRSVTDALVALKITGVSEVPTQKVLDDFASRGIKLSAESLQQLLLKQHIVKDINKDRIIFNDEPEVKSNNDVNKKYSDMTVSQMAKAALNKRMK